MIPTHRILTHILPSDNTELDAPVPAAAARGVSAGGGPGHARHRAVPDLRVPGDRLYCRYCLPEPPGELARLGNHSLSKIYGVLCLIGPRFGLQPM